MRPTPAFSEPGDQGLDKAQAFSKPVDQVPAAHGSDNIAKQLPHDSSNLQLPLDLTKQHPQLSRSNQEPVKRQLFRKDPEELAQISFDHELQAVPLESGDKASSDLGEKIKSSSPKVGNESVDSLLKSKNACLDQLSAIRTRLGRISSPIATSTPNVVTTHPRSKGEHSQPPVEAEKPSGSPIIRRSTFPSRSPAIKRARSRRKVAEDVASDEGVDMPDDCYDSKSGHQTGNNSVLLDQPPLRNRLHERSLMLKSQILSQQNRVLSPATMQSTSAVLTKVHRVADCSQVGPMKRSLSADGMVRGGGRTPNSMKGKRRLSLFRPSGEDSLERKDHEQEKASIVSPPSLTACLSMNVTMTPSYLSPGLKRESLKSLMKKPLLNHCRFYGKTSLGTCCWNSGEAESKMPSNTHRKRNHPSSSHSTQSVETPLLFSDEDDDDEIVNLLTDNEAEDEVEEDAFQANVSMKDVFAVSDVAHEDDDFNVEKEKRDGERVGKKATQRSEDLTIEDRVGPATQNVSEDYGDIEILKDFQSKGDVEAEVMKTSDHENIPEKTRTNMKLDESKLTEAISRYLLSSQFRENIRDLCHFEE